MNEYYEILGLQPGASEKEIKSAYFKLVRKYSPEKDPEMFQKVRMAYEHLKESSKEKELVLEFPSDSFAKIYADRIIKAYNEREFEYGIRLAEEAVEHFGEIEGFLYYLGHFQAACGYTGKSVKTFEKLVCMKPDKIEFLQDLAVAYYERGFVKKAYSTFEKAYNAGARNEEFLSVYAICLMDRENFEQCIVIFRDLITIYSKDKNKTEELIKSYESLVRMHYESGIKPSDDLLKEIVEFIRKSRVYAREYESELIELSIEISNMLHMYPDDKAILAAKEESYKLMESYFDDEFKAEYQAQECALDMDFVAKLGVARPVFELCLANDIFLEAMHMEDSEYFKFYRLNILLICLERWDEYKQQFEKIEESCHVLFGKLKPYIQKIQEAYDNDKVDMVRDMMLKDYNRMYAWYSDEIMDKLDYYEEYPDVKVRMNGNVTWDSDLSGTYIRENVKIGRNDPCPCGSGKKYKKCCGRG